MIIQEGLVRVEVPDEHRVRGPGKRGPGFYNADQKINRDLTVAYVSTVRPSFFLDAFGGSGIRGIRVERETGTRTVISEINPVSAATIEENISRNGSRCTLIGDNCETVMSEFKFDFIDIDPYGSALPYIDSALRNVKNGGHIGVTATDLSALTGSAGKVTRRRYSANLTVDSLKHEKGIRLLIRAVIERGAQYEMAAEPMMSFWHSHFYRVIFGVTRGAGRCDRLLEEISPILLNGREEGPLWLGKLETRLLDRTLRAPEHVASDIRAGRFLRNLPDEDLMPLFIDLGDREIFNGGDIPSVSRTVARLAENGFAASRTHFSPTGIKIGGEWDISEIRKIAYAK